MKSPLCLVSGDVTVSGSCRFSSSDFAGVGGATAGRRDERRVFSASHYCASCREC